MKTSHNTAKFWGFKQPLLTIAIWGAFAASPLTAEEAEQKTQTPTPYYGVYEELPITDIAPEGWLRQWLETQKDGLTGHPEVMKFPLDTTKAWGEEIVPDGDVVGDIYYNWWAYEQLGYYANGVLRCGLLLRDQELIAKGRKHTDYVMAHLDGLSHHANFNWVRAQMFRALIAEYGATGDATIPSKLRDFILAMHDRAIAGRRANSIIETICWNYRMTGDKRLLDKAVAAYEAYCVNEDKKIAEKNLMSRTKGIVPLTKAVLLSDNPLLEHGVTTLDMLKTPAILYMHTGNKEYLNASVNAFAKLERDNMMVIGSPGAEEDLKSPIWLAMAETCTTIDMGWSTGYMLLATGSTKYADLLERCTFNALPGCVGKDFKSYQYFSSPNQVIATHTSYIGQGVHPPHRQAYAPGHLPACCAGSVHMGMPNYISRMWFKGKGGVVAAAVYGPSKVQIRSEAGRKVYEITEETDYPFSETIKFRVKAESPVRFPFHLRIPGWCTAATLTVNGQPDSSTCKAGTFAVLDREFKDGDIIELRLPMPLKTTHWPDNGVALERGPLVYALKIEEQAEVRTDMMRGNKEFPAYNYTPKSEWRYAWALPDAELAAQIKVVTKAMPANPWEVGASPVELEVPLKKVVSPWDFEHRPDVIEVAFNKVCKSDWWKNAMPPGPQHPKWPKDVKVSETQERLTLVPMGGTHLRLTVFPDGRATNSTSDKTDSTEKKP